MKLKMALYWITTTLIALETLVGGFMDVFSSPHATDVLTRLGYPLYVLIILGIWKIPGAITLLVPRLLRLKEWAYAGIVFELSAAVASHAFRGQWSELVAPVFLLCLALASWALRPPDRILGSTLVAKS